jgi:hypothetical protein
MDDRHRPLETRDDFTHSGKKLVQLDVIDISAPRGAGRDRAPPRRR